MTIREVAYHRNGVCGAPFHAVRFRFENEEMLAIVFEEPGECAVLSIPKLSEPAGVAFGRNSWRGDHFETDVRRAIADWETEQTLSFG